MVELIQKYLKDEIELEYGKSLIKSERVLGNIPVYGSNGIIDHNEKMLYKGPGIIIGRKGTIGSIKYEESDFWAIDTTYIVKLKKDNNMSFWYYFLQTLGLEKMNSHSAVPGLNRDRIYNLKINMPKDEKYRKKISDILYNIDNKIELNNQINNNLYDIGLNIYLKNYKNNENCSFKKLGDFFPVVTGKKDANASSKNGIYPFFTCSQNPLKIDNYSFDDYAILLAGNGDFNVKFYSGKFDAYQRTYVLIPKNKKKIGFLYYSIKYNLNDLTSGHRGSVIKFITKGNIENYLVPYIENNEIESILNLFLENIEKNNKENMVLEKLRDTLLPKLMNGEIDLENIEI